MTYSLPPAPVEERRPIEPSDTHALDWLPQLIGFLWRRWALILACALAVGALAAGYALSARPVYTAIATVLIDTRKLHPFRQQALVGEPGSEAAFVETQVQVMGSDEVTREVVRRLDLLNNGIFTGEALPPVGGIAGLVAELRQLPRRLAGPPPGGAAPVEQPTREQLELRAAELLGGMMRTRRIGGTSLVTVQVSVPDPELAARLANTVVASYIDTQLGAIADSTRRASVWLEERMRALREAALAADREVQDYRVRNNIIGTDRGLINEQQLQELATQLTQARGRVSEAEARLARIQGAAEADLQDRAVSEMLQSSVVNQLRSQMLELSRRESEFAQRFGQNHNSVAQLRNEIAELRRSMASELRRILDSARSDLAGARENETQTLRQMDELVQQWAVTNSDRITLRALEGQAASYRQLFENFLVRYNQVVQDESYPVSDARMVSAATTPTAPSDPRRLLYVAAGLSLGIALGFTLATAIEAADRRMRTPMQARLAAGVECLGIVPQLRRGLIGGDAAALMREVLERPDSRFSEALLGLQTRVVQQLQRLRNAQVVMCVGTSQGAGTSTVAAALSLCLAQSGRRTVLVDWDLRKGTISAALATAAPYGFLDVFEGRIALGEALLRDQQTGLKLLAAGGSDQPRHPAGVLGSERALTVIAQLRAEHDVVVVDLPALGPLADAHAAASAADAVLLVLAWGGPGPHEVAELLSRFDTGNAALLGCVLNKVDTVKAMRYVLPGGAAYIKAV